ncbi:MAG: transglycosylase SLT domain-containing protein, partial [Bacteroidales bacterium]|nr:transglycosylase SLT domain-containing protein [Bacteroidales bacterium]
AYNERVEVFIEVYTIKKHKQLHVMLALSQYYFPIFEEALRQEGLPEELKYMAIIESALNPRAISPAGAAGIWQFMYQTGRMCHLKINTKVDERLDPIKASQAAAIYLKELYRCFNDWTLAIAAYNCGPGNVNKAIRRAKGQTDFWKIYPYLPRETRGYVPAFIAAAYAVNYHEEHGQCPPRHYTPILTDTLHFTHDLDLRQVADGLHMPLQILKDLNPQYKINLIPHEGGSFCLRLPASMIGDFLENKEAILADTTWKDYYPIWEEVVISHRVRRGETLSSIAKRYGVKVDDLMNWNKLRSTVIYANQLLRIHTMREKAPRLSYTAATLPPPIDTILDSATLVLPQSLHTTTATRRPQSCDSSVSTPTATSRPGLTATGRPVNKPAPTATTAPTTASAHDNIQGQAVEQAAQKGREVEYRVRRGDTLYEIWRKHPGSSIKEIVARNNLSRNGNLIYPNQILIIPVH